MAAYQNYNQATQHGIVGQQIFLNQSYTNQKYGQALNLSNNTNYSISPNAVKLLPIVSNDRNYVKLYTETNASVEIGDMVYIMFDNNMSADPIQQNSTGMTILDSYYEFSGCTDWIYLNQIQGYEVFDIDETNNTITIKRFYDSSLNGVQLYNHYIGKIYVNKINFYGGWIDGVMFRNVNLNSITDTYIDVDIKQCIILSGGTTTGVTAYYIDMRDKYDSQYVSVNSNLTFQTQSKMSPYKYNSTNIIQPNQNLTSSYFTYNNNSFGYSYLYFSKLFNSRIDNGYYNNCIISGGTITNGNFTNCTIYDTEIQSGSFINCTINSNCNWYYGIWSGSGITSFGPSVWYNGVWNEGIFSGKTWVSGIFNSGVFTDSLWVSGIFNGGGSIFNPNNQENFKNSYWSGGTFNNGYMKDCIWIKGTFNAGIMEENDWFNGTFNGGTFLNSYWTKGIFNNGLFTTSYWFDGNFNNGTFSNSIWYDGYFNNGLFKTGYGGDVFQVSATTNKWYNGTFNFGEFNSSIWLGGTFNNGFIENSLWSGGTFNYGEFNDSLWIDGNWNNGIVNNSIFNRCNWKNGTFNSGYMGKEYLITDPTIPTLPIIYWSGGTFNNGIFGSKFTLPTQKSISFWYGGDFYGGKFYNYLYPTPPGYPSSFGTYPGFYDGVFHEGLFYGDYWGGHWVNGFFGGNNHTSQIIPHSYKYNINLYGIGGSGNFNLQ